MYLCSVHMCLVPQDIRRGRWLDLLELELQMILHHHMSAGNQTQVLSENNTCS